MAVARIGTPMSLVLHLHEGMIGVTGEEGCRKSNIPSLPEGDHAQQVD